jgi:hypothetical protein
MTTSLVHLKRRDGVVVQDCDLYIGRACNMGGWRLPQSKWFNPFTVAKHGADAIPLYEQYIRSSPLMNDLEELRGKRLGCWCTPNPCHGDVLIKLLAEKDAQRPRIRLVIVPKQ